MKERKDQSIFTPIQGACLLQNALTAVQPSIFVSKVRPEEAIRTCFSFPQVVWIGNLNWINEKAEKLSFSYLILKYDMGEMRVVLGCQKGKKDQPLSKEDSEIFCKSLKLFF